MKRILLLIVSLLIIGCSSITKNNKQAAQLRSVSDLKRDVDYAYKKMQRLHPNLYWYISKKDLDYKFDSLKTTINKPMNSVEFFKKISPVVASVRQGHMGVYPLTKQPTKAESKALISKGVGPFTQFDFEMVDNKIYVTKNKSYDKTIKPGSEVLAINNTPPSELFKDYATWFASDGYNQTFKKAKLTKVLPAYYSYDNGILDSIVYSFRYNDSIKTVSIKRQIVDSVKPVKKEIKKLTSIEKKAAKEKLKAEKRKKSVYGYNEFYKNYNRNLSFREKDSSVAVMKIRGFSIGNPYAFYRESFQRIKKNKSNTLVIDLRDNPGGSLNEIADLYSYLSDSTYIFTDKSEVATKTSLLKADYFKGGSISTKIIKGVFSPLYVGYTFFKVHKDENGKYYYGTSANKPHKINPIAFKGKIYVLINGGSFSASCILSSNLKGSKRAYFVGEETGGAFNGTVAGRMPVVTLPNSKVKIKMGLMAIAPHHKTDIEGRGIFPDKEVIPTLEDRISGNDPEMNWVIADIKANQKPAEETASN